MTNMTSTDQTTKDFEQRIDQAVAQLENSGKMEQALSAYKEIERGLLETEMTPDMECERQRVLAYCYMRQANLYRQIGKGKKAEEATVKEVAAAKESGDQVSYGRSLLSDAANKFRHGMGTKGIHLLDMAEEVFNQGESAEHKQGLGWAYILRADLMESRLMPGTDDDIIQFASVAIDVLEPIKNYPGLVRAHSVRARAYERLGKLDNQQADDQKADEYRKAQLETVTESSDVNG